MTSQDENKACVICLEDMSHLANASYLPCFHGFHQDCFHHYITDKIKTKKNITCPVCRAEHFVYGHKNYVFIMNELGLSPDEDNRITTSPDLQVGSFGEPFLPGRVYTNMIFDTNTNNINPNYPRDMAISDTVIHIPIRSPIRSPRRRQNISKLHTIWFHYRYFIIAVILIIVISLVIYILVTSTKN